MLNPTKLKSLVDQQTSAPNAAALGMAPPGEMSDEEYDDEDEGGDEPMEPSAKGSALITSWGEFGKTLEESADDLHDLAHDIGAELLLKEVPKNAIKDVGKSVDRMPDDLSMGLAKYVSELSPEDCEAVAAALAAKIGEDKADGKLLYAYLHQAAAYAKEEIEVDEDFNVPEEDEEADDEARDDEAPPPAAEGDGGPVV